jgi:methyl-accepting chemotaxis protein
MSKTDVSNLDPRPMFGLFGPGIRLMGNLQFSGKALLICLVFLLPVVWSSWSLYSTKASSMAFSTKELLGVKYNREIFPLINAAQQLRRDATAMAANGATPSTLADVQVKLKQAQEKLAAVDGELGSQLDTSKAYAAVQKAFTDAMAAGSAAKGMDAVFEAHTAHIKALVALMLQVTDASNLTLDPDIDSYYLMDSSYFRMPDILESTGKLQGYGPGHHEGWHHHRTAARHLACFDAHRRFSVQQYARWSGQGLCKQPGLGLQG